MQDLFIQADPSRRNHDFISETNFESPDIFNDSYLNEFELQLYYSVIRDNTYFKSESSDYINSHINMDDHLLSPLNKILVPNSDL